MLLRAISGMLTRCIKRQLWVMAGSFSLQLACVAQQSPNIILILADDLGYGDLSCYGQQKFKTPNIDALAAGGVLFTNGYAGATVCSPSRAALITGLHNGHNPVRGNQPFPQNLNGVPTIAQALKRLGYSTAVIGKWGIGHPQPVGDPQSNGFDYSFGYLNMWHAHNYFPEFLYENDKRILLPGNKLKPQKDWSNNSWVGGEEKYLPDGYGEAATKQTYVPDVMEEKAIDFISRQKAPFFLWFTTTIPHSNNEIKTQGMEVPDFGSFANKNWPDVEKGFAAAITRLDATVGKIRQAIEKQGLAKNTIIIFTSDNGPHAEGGHNPAFFSSSGGLRGKKRDLYEGGIRVPFIVWAPGRADAGLVSAEPVVQYDLPSTFLSLTGISAQVADGISLLPALNGEKLTPRNLYWEFYEEGGKQAVLRYPWKLIRLNTSTFSTDGKYELYNIEKDSAEQVNLIYSHSKIADRLKREMSRQHVPHPNMSLFTPKPGQGGKT